VDVDYRTLNKKIVKNYYPLPHIDNLFDQLAYAWIISSFELGQGYEQIGIFLKMILKLFLDCY
jgi:hypothetical protein